MSVASHAGGFLPGAGTGAVQGAPDHPGEGCLSSAAPVQTAESRQKGNDQPTVDLLQRNGGPVGLADQPTELEELNVNWFSLGSAGLRSASYLRTRSHHSWFYR